jgi:hypothetical protein
MKSALVVTMLAASIGTPVAFRDMPTKEAAQAAMDRAMHYESERGPVALVRSLQLDNSPLHNGRIRVFALDRDGRVLADSIQPQRVGLDVRALKDVDGAQPYQEALRLAHDSGSNWVYYRTRDPVTRTERAEAALVQRVDGVVLVSARAD